MRAAACPAPPFPCRRPGTSSAARPRRNPCPTIRPAASWPGSPKWPPSAATSTPIPKWAWRKCAPPPWWRRSCGTGASRSPRASAGPAWSARSRAAAPASAPSGCAPTWTRWPSHEATGCAYASTHPAPCMPAAMTATPPCCSAPPGRSPGTAISPAPCTSSSSPPRKAAAAREAMIADGLFDRFPCDAIYGMHNMPGMPVGQLRHPQGAVPGRRRVLGGALPRHRRARRGGAAPGGRPQRGGGAFHARRCRPSSGATCRRWKPRC